MPSHFLPDATHFSKLLIDPQDSRLDDPWRHLDLSVHVSLSKRAYNRLRKEHGLPPREIPKKEDR